MGTLTNISQETDHALARQLQQVRTQAQQAQSELERQEEQLHDTGRALEYYQRLRQTLVDWVGALRQLQAKIVPVQTSLHGLMADMNCHQRRRDWQKDMIAVLFKHNRLDRVLGSQVDDDPQALFDPLQTDLAVAAVDEFGRNVQSLSALQREQRRRHRLRIRQQRAESRGSALERDPEMIMMTMTMSRGDRDDESDAYLSDDEKENFRERHAALLKAVEVATHELDEEFTCLQNLVNVFEEWKQRYGDDYRQCYASLSLADLASVLILTELCALNDPWNESGGYNEGKWIAVIKSATDLGLLDGPGVERILEKSVYPSVADLLKRSGYAIMSSRQSAALSSFVKHVMKIAPPHSPSMDKTKRKLQVYIAMSLLDISIPIVRRDSQSTLVSEELEEVLDGATVGQMHSLQKLLLNVITYWGPVLGTDDAFVESVLDFISNKFLFFLSSLQQDVTGSTFSESPAELFREVWDALLPLGWLNDPKWMLRTLAIRAACSAFTVEASASQSLDG